MSELETRSVEIRSVDAEKRELRGVALPWGEIASIAGGVYRERWERGGLELAPGGAKLYAVHEHQRGALPIGNVTEARDTDRGKEIVARVARTARGDEVLALAEPDDDGNRALGHFSIGFEPKGHRIDRDDQGEIVTRTHGVLREVSVVPFPAYAGATISEVRAAAVDPAHSEGESMTTTTTTTEPQNRDQGAGGGVTYAEATEVEQLRSELTEATRRLDTLPETLGTSGSARSQYRSGGEFLKGLLAGDEAARTELRELDFRDGGTAPATSALAIPDAGGPGWLNRPVRHVLERRRIINLFSRESLPAEGNTIEWPMVDQAATSGAVEKQATEGEALAYMEVKLKTGTASVGTYGGFSELTRQAIERGNPAYLSAVLNYQAIQYAKATNLGARNAFQAITPGATIEIGTSTALTFADAKAADWLAMLVDAGAAIEDSSLGMLAEFVVVSRDVGKSIVTLTDSTDRPVFGVAGGGQGVNTIGSADPVRAEFQINNIPGFVDPKLPAKTVKVAASEAMTTLESPGAPFRLTDDDIVSLTRAFSLYGFAAWTENDANAVVAISENDGV